MKYKIETAKRVINDLRGDGLENKDIAEVLKQALHICGVSQRSELFALLKYLNPDPDIHANDEDINEIIDEYYKANCG